MRGIFKAFVCLIALNFPNLSFADNLELPVVDRAATFSSSHRASLIEKLVQLRNSRNVSFVILTIPTLNGEAVEAVAEREFKQMQIGNKALDNGLLFVMSPNDHKMRLEVGYGLEGDLPDVVAKRLLSDQVAPFFKNQQYFEGTLHLIDLVQSRNYALPEHQPAQAGTLFWTGFLVSGFLFLLVFIMLISGPIEQKNQMLSIVQASIPPRLQTFLANEKSARRWLGLFFLVEASVFGFYLYHLGRYGLTEESMRILLATFLTGLGTAIASNRYYQKYTWQDLLNECDDQFRPLVKARIFALASRGVSSNSGVDSSGSDSSGWSSTTTDGGFSDGGSSGGGGASSDW